MSCKILSNNKISDKEFLELLIKHHNISINKSQIVMMTSSDDFIIDFARRAIYNNTNSVMLMERLLKNIPNIQNEKSCNCANSVLSAKLDQLYPNIFNNLKCNESQFNILEKPSIQLDENSQFESIGSQISSTEKLNLDNFNKISDEEYVTNMLEYHKYSIDLSSILIKSTKEPKLLHLAQTILLNQEKELFLITNLYGCTKYNWRNSLNMKS
jgi:uncharacterized protein (DUF305 family)